MAYGLKNVLGAAFTDTSIQILPDDLRLTAGSLVLNDPAHSIDPIAAGLPASGSTIPNLAWKQLGVVLGTTTTKVSNPSTLLYGGNVGASGSVGKLERSTKGGLHGIITQVGSLVSGDGCDVQIDAAVRTYMAANPAHAYYVGVWGKLTRADPTPASGSAAEMMSMGMASSTSNLLSQLLSNGQAAGTRSGTAAVPSAVGDFGAAVANSAAIGTPSGGSASGRAAVWGARAGGYNAAVLASRNTHWPSWVWYSTYIEDLTVSGRSYATVKALDDAARALAFGTGGRYAGDTYTAPSTLP